MVLTCRVQGPTQEGEVNETLQCSHCNRTRETSILNEESKEYDLEAWILFTLGRGRIMKGHMYTGASISENCIAALLSLNKSDALAAPV